jgi:toxin ParE1/3/4
VKPAKVFFTAGAERDLQELYDFVAAHDSVAQAERLLDRIETMVADLATSPDRGAHPRELSALGIRDYRQVLFKPYRVIYRLTGAKVIIYLVADGRRDMGTLLARRLLTG